MSTEWARLITCQVCRTGVWVAIWVGILVAAGMCLDFEGLL
jgi:hypothetical protein